MPNQYTVPEGFPEVPLHEGLGMLPSDISRREVGRLDVFDCEVGGRRATLTVRRKFEGRSDLLGLWWLDGAVGDDEVTTLVEFPPSIIYVEGAGKFGSTAPEDAVAAFLGIWVPCPEKVEEDLGQLGVAEEQLDGTLHHLYTLALRCGVITLPVLVRAKQACGDACWDESRRRIR